MANTTFIQELESDLRTKLRSQVRDLCLLPHDQGVVIRGRSVTFHGKQMAQQLVMKGACRVHANLIEVA